MLSAEKISMIYTEALQASKYNLYRSRLPQKLKYHADIIKILLALGQTEKARNSLSHARILATQYELDGTELNFNLGAGDCSNCCCYLTVIRGASDALQGATRREDIRAIIKNLVKYITSYVVERTPEEHGEITNEITKFHFFRWCKTFVHSFEPALEREKIIQLYLRVAKQYRRNKEYKKAIKAIRYCTDLSTNETKYVFHSWLIKIYLLQEKYSQASNAICHGKLLAAKSGANERWCTKREATSIKFDLPPGNASLCCCEIR
eukprot:516437_1